MNTNSFFRILLLTIACGGCSAVFANTCTEVKANSETIQSFSLGTGRNDLVEYLRFHITRLDQESRIKPSQRVIKEIKSLLHQQSLQVRTRRPLKQILDIISARDPKEAELGLLAFEKSIADSDKGKMLFSQEESWRPSNELQKSRSNILLDLLTLRPSKNSKLRRAQRALEEVLVSDYNGRPGEGILPRNYDNDQIRSIVQKNFFLPGSLHDLPGLLDAYFEFASTNNVALFKTRIRINFSHNGPGRNTNPTEGFWGFLFKVKLKEQLTANGTPDFFEGTIYSDGRGGIRYPEGSHPLWFLHTATDRLSGKLNLLKFMAEVPDADVINTFATSYHARGVISQLNQLTARLNEVYGVNKNSEYKFLLNYIETLKLQQQAFADALNSKLKFGPPDAAGNVDSFTILNTSGGSGIEYKLERTQGNRISRNGEAIKLQDFLALLDADLFTPLSNLDPLRE